MSLFEAAIDAFRKAGRLIGGWRRTGLEPWHAWHPLSPEARAYWARRRAEIERRRVRRWQRAHSRNTATPPRHIRDAMRVRS